MSSMPVEHGLSIRRRLLRGILGGLAAVWVLNMLFVLGVVVYESRQDLDEDLALSADLLVLRAVGGRAGLPELPLELLYQVWNAQGRLLEDSARMATPLAPLSPGYHDILRDGARWRAYVAHDAPAGLDVVVAAPGWHHRGAAMELALLLLLPVMLVFPALAAIIGAVVERATGEVAQAARDVAAYEREAHAPVAVDRLPAEVQPLAGAFNSLLLRLREVLDDERRFNDAAAHELRTPLSAIRLDAQLLQRGPDSAEVVAMAARIEKASATCARLVEELLTIARLSSWAAGQDMPTMPLGQIVDVILQEIERTQRERPQHLVREVEEDLPVPLSQAVHLILRNLLDNALRHAEGASRIGLRAGREGGQLRIVVEDDGIGIPPADRERVFERFARLGSRREGTGLGLYIVRRAAERLGGSARAVDPEGGRGIRMEVRLPLRPPVAVAPGVTVAGSA